MGANLRLALCEGGSVMSSDDYRAVINRNLIESAVDASPHKIAIIAVSNGAGASQIDDLLGHRFATDHVAVAWFDERTQTYQLAEMTPGGEYTPGSIGQSKFSDPGTSDSQDFMYRVASSMLGSKNDPGTINSLSMGSQDVTAIPLMNSYGGTSQRIFEFCAAIHGRRTTRQAQRPTQRSAPRSRTRRE